MPSQIFFSHVRIFSRAGRKILRDMTNPQLLLQKKARFAIRMDMPRALSELLFDLTGYERWLFDYAIENKNERCILAIVDHVKSIPLLLAELVQSKYFTRVRYCKYLPESIEFYQKLVDAGVYFPPAVIINAIHAPHNDDLVTLLAPHTDVYIGEQRDTSFGKSALCYAFKRKRALAPVLLRSMRDKIPLIMKTEPCTIRLIMDECPLDIELLGTVLEVGIPVDTAIPCGTKLAEAAKAGMVDIVAFLLEKGAALTQDYSTVMHTVYIAVRYTIIGKDRCFDAFKLLFPKTKENHRFPDLFSLALFRENIPVLKEISADRGKSAGECVRDLRDYHSTRTMLTFIPISDRIWRDFRAIGICIDDFYKENIKPAFPQEFCGDFFLPEISVNSLVRNAMFHGMKAPVDLEKVCYKTHFAYPIISGNQRARRLFVTAMMISQQKGIFSGTPQELILEILTRLRRKIMDRTFSTHSNRWKMIPYFQ